MMSPYPEQGFDLPELNFNGDELFDTAGRVADLINKMDRYDARRLILRQIHRELLIASSAADSIDFLMLDLKDVENKEK